jgi:glyoxylase-like metal-dependent hydrolase (beta-lactamase superfamily II)/rhodanese-related sulfurtransferase
MTNEIDVETLRRWLDEHRQIAVLDVRARDDRAQWWIPNSTHVDAYEALRNGEPGPLATLPLPAREPVVTVCGAGRLSRTAAEILSARGLNAYSLIGGMRAWSLAWNTADVPMPDATARVVQVRRTGKGCLSYIVGADDAAVVIDAALAPDVYLTIARARGWRIRYVLDTHIHADHLSRSRQLAEESGATIMLPQQQRVRFPYSALADGDQLQVGTSMLTASRTPGHTLESMSYVLNSETVFSGDTLFTFGVGRPDLHADASGARARGRELYRSLTRLRSLPPSTLVLPGHASEPIPFDHRPIAATMKDIDAWLSTWLMSEEAFIDRLVSRLPPTPPNFAHIVALNELGHVPDADAIELEAGANRCAVA